MAGEPWSYQAEILTNPDQPLHRGCSRHLGLLRGSFGLWISRACALPQEPFGERMLCAHDIAERMIPMRLTMESEPLEELD